MKAIKYFHYANISTFALYLKIIICLYLCLPVKQLYSCELDHNSYRYILAADKERIMAENLLGSLRAGQYISDDLLAQEYLTTLGRKLSGKSAIREFKPTFFLLNDPTANAFAYLAAHIGVNEGMVLLCEEEAQLAAVLAHELAHVRQQHLLQLIQHQKHQNIITLAELIAASVIGAPGLIVPILSGNIQNSIYFTQTHEKEADRVGMQILTAAKFDPHAMPMIFKNMQKHKTFISETKSYLSTHPLDDTRIAETSSLAHNYPYQQFQTSADFAYIKQRIQLKHTRDLYHQLEIIKHDLRNSPKDTLLNYSLAYLYLLLEDHELAIQILKPLLNKNNSWLIDLTLAEILSKTQHQQAIKILTSLNIKHPNSYTVLILLAHNQLRLDNIIAAKHTLLSAQKIAEREPAIYDLLAQIFAIEHNISEQHASQAEWYMLHSDYDNANLHFSLALQHAENNPSISPIAITRLKQRKQATKRYLESTST